MFDLQNAEKLQELAGDEFADARVATREEDKIKSNRAYADANKKNYSNPTCSQTRCGTCAGNGSLTQDELVSYAKAHDDDLKGHSVSSKNMKKWITKHARPQHHQSFDEYDVTNGVELGALDHSEYACTDCEHWDNQVGGWVSDGVCGQCLGDGSVNKDDEHLLEHIENHKHKAGVAMTPEKLAKMTDMQKLRGM